eukprot:TRINITY_DN9331_c0_g2_i1.p1 TRINITY_DN9331_c0_g2~~TRINITY_DN9331_c0_g2_i1.p1  ORF type:complete len:613 (-),score=117.32 TRINITY_DN9331_c0_g2_i1:165-2003(-)
MADRVEEVMEAMVPELDDFRRKKIFNEDEIRHIVKRRRDFEYALLKPKVTPMDFLKAIRYEVALDTLRRHRSNELRWRKRTVSDGSGLRRMLVIFNRAVLKFKGNMRMWYQYIDFCLRSGSTNALSKVLLKCAKLHPKEVNVWLLAADRSLKCGQVKAARTLMLRGLRFSPRNAKLWGELFRLEVQAARNVELVGKELEGDPAKGPWAPATLMLKRASQRLSESPNSCAAFLATAVSVMQIARKELGEPDNKTGPAGLLQLEKQIHMAIVEHRPTSTATSAPAAATKQLWELWWSNEQSVLNKSWQEIGREITASAAPAALSHFALTVAKTYAANLAAGEAAEDALQTLLDIAVAPRSKEDSDVALAILEALEASNVKDAVVLKFLTCSVQANPACFRLRLLASKRLEAGEFSLDAREAGKLRDGAIGIDGEALRGLQEHSAAQVLKVASAPAAAAERLMGCLRSLAPGQSPGPVLELYLAQALACGTIDFRAASTEALKVVSSLWDCPKVRVEGLGVLLLAEVRTTPLSELRPRQLCDRFEQILDSLDDEDNTKLDWWVRYVEFAHRLAKLNKADDVPTSADLHWRAMRSVKDQTRYTERVHMLLESSVIA